MNPTVTGLVLIFAEAVDSAEGWSRKEGVFGVVK